LRRPNTAKAHPGIIYFGAVYKKVQTIGLTGYGPEIGGAVYDTDLGKFRIGANGIPWCLNFFFFFTGKYPKAKGKYSHYDFIEVC
jgi:hypothetical protein